MSTGVQLGPNVQTISFRKPTNQAASSPSTKPKNRHGGLLQDQLRRAQRAPWCPTWSSALRILLLIRVAGAMYNGIQDCDEVYNFWEPLHYLWKGYGFQTWETSPEYSIRSWAYILLHYLPVQLSAMFLGPEKRPAFFAVRIFLAIVSSLCEVTFYRAVVEHINYRVGRYVFFMLLANAGMWIASTSFLPSSFAMYANTLGFAHAMERPSNSNMRRTLFATLCFATGAIVGWPFSLAVAIPFVLEELFLTGADKVTSETRTSWLTTRWQRMAICGAIAALLFIPVVAIDTLFYNKLSVVPWNIVKYNVFPDAQRGPELYGTEPVHFYLANLLLNFNVLVPFAFAALPALLVTYRFDHKRLGERYLFVNQSSPYVLLAVRLAPVYLWVAIMTTQKHKEERFMYPIYPFICFNAAVTIYLVRGWLEAAFIAATNSPYRASRSSLFSQFTLSVVVTSSVLSLARTMAHWKYYHAPLSVTYALEAAEVPRLLNATGHVSLPPQLDPAARHGGQEHPEAESDSEEQPRIDLSLVEPFNLRLCVGKEWHRFPGHFIVPDGVRVDWVKSAFDGMLPGHFSETPRKGGLLVRQQGTRVVPKDLNDLNKEARAFYVDVDSCDYLLDLDFPQHPQEGPHEPRYIVDEQTWARVACQPFLDAAHSPLLTRTLWFPGALWQQQNSYGEFCLLRHRANVAKKEREHTVHRA
ncbi:asparagine-linked glycosylation 9 protein isoform a [Dichomitus squalens LYAD-421 SS1]|uniref:asparagine-linked glycosylation 9 protein isoform a n=1 Tax=Dichomitus squalens (strain LYAD-421) TaxID=732165 RepID=UPI0004410C24|nr:asparagine-linked glycosylation 9 protein isoform a [Dichomitus squalens LYAD-421 SS1]EJF67085.1 asparagine-linked glycosylation 9 protein isoform a [Dichomitus squalens LYAD-421 SS1]